MLKYALIVFGVVFCLIYPLSILWPSGWSWHAGAPYESDYFLMIVGVYATHGALVGRRAGPRRRGGALPVEAARRLKGADRGR